MSESTMPTLRPLQAYLIRKFQGWSPRAPSVLARTPRSVTLEWLEEEPFGFVREHLLYTVQRKDKLPPWVTVYSGGKTTKAIEDLAPSHPHKFRLRVILKSTAVSSLAEAAIEHHGSEDIVYHLMESMEKDEKVPTEDDNGEISKQTGKHESRLKSNGSVKDTSNVIKATSKEIEEASGEFAADNMNCVPNAATTIGDVEIKLKGKSFAATERSENRSSSRKWLESRWSEETWTSTAPDGSSAGCFCMAVRCGYFQQAQIMLEERPVLIGAINSHNGLTPLATAVWKGDASAVRFVLALGADVEQPAAAGRRALHLAVLAGHAAVADLLLEKGADFQVRDINRLRIEHYAVDSCQLEMVKYVMDKGGDVGVTDGSGWTPLFRAVIQGASTQVIEELLHRGSSVEVVDKRGLTLVAAARLLKNRQGRPRESVLRLVDAQFPHEKALANFSRLTKKIYSVHTLMK